jgi:ATP-binding cassette, subfamily B, heavy metal transporter
MWPEARPDLKFRVLLAFVLLLGAKLSTIVMPFAFKYATDALVAVSEGKPLPPEAIYTLLATPAALVVMYGLLRVATAVLTQLRDGVFAKVAMHAVRRLAQRRSSTCTRSPCAFIWSARPAA